MSDHSQGEDTKYKKAFDRNKRRQRFREAIKYHLEPGAKQLESTTVKGGSVEPSKEGLNEDFESKVGQGLRDLRSGLFTAREKARARGRSLKRSR